MLRPIQRESLVNHAVTTIHNYIIDEAMQPGDQLPPERQLAGALVISRVTLRNALAILEGKGAIKRDRGRATVVASLVGIPHMGSPAKLRRELSRLMELRFAVEVGAAEYACRGRTDEQVARLHALVDKMAKENLAGHPVSEYDVQFHLILLECAGESFVESFGDTVQEFFRLSTLARPWLIARGQSEQIVAEHKAILAALQKRDAAGLRQLHLQAQERDPVTDLPSDPSAAPAPEPDAAKREGH